MKRTPGRRRLLQRSFAAGASLLLSACDRLTLNQPFSDLMKNAQWLSRAAQDRLAGPHALAQEFSPAEIREPFRPNGTLMPAGAAYQALLADGFARWRLRVDGLVRTPLDLSLTQLRAMPRRTQITRHDCVEGWSCIGQWSGVQLARVLAQAQPMPRARYVVFHCADQMEEGDPGSLYYESIDLDDAFHPQTLLAFELNGRALPVENGAPLRLRVERQLGYKHAKYVMRVELVESFAQLHGGQGGYWEDQGYEWYAGI